MCIIKREKLIWVFGTNGKLMPTDTELLSLAQQLLFPRGQVPPNSVSFFEWPLKMTWGWGWWGWGWWWWVNSSHTAVFIYLTAKCLMKSLCRSSSGTSSREPIHLLLHRWACSHIREPGQSGQVSAKKTEKLKINTFWKKSGAMRPIKTVQITICGWEATWSSLLVSVTEAEVIR